MEIAIVAIIFLASVACVISGVYLLAGLGWSIIAAGVLLFGLGVHLRSALKSNG